MADLKTRPKILHIQITAELGGCERLCESFIRATPDYQSFVLLLCPVGPAVKHWSREGAEVISVGLPNQSRLITYWSLHQAVRRLKPDLGVIWTSARLPFLSSACWTAGLRKLAVHIGNPLRLTWAERLASRSYALLPGSLSAFVISASHHVERSVLNERPFCGKNLRVCYNGIDLSAFQFKPKARLQVPPIVGMSARLDPIKDHRTLLFAWRDVVLRRPDAKLELAGDGAMRCDLEALAGQLGIRNSVTFLGRLDDILTRMYAWDIMVHSTTENEGLGNSMVEAMAIGRALVATNTGPVSEIADTETAELVPPRDPAALAQSILTTLEYGLSVQNRVKSARSKVERKFSSRLMAECYLEALAAE